MVFVDVERVESWESRVESRELGVESFFCISYPVNQLDLKEKERRSDIMKYKYRTSLSLKSNVAHCKVGITWQTPYTHNSTRFLGMVVEKPLLASFEFLISEISLQQFLLLQFAYARVKPPSKKLHTSMKITVNDYLILMWSPLMSLITPPGCQYFSIFPANPNY